MSDLFVCVFFSLLIANVTSLENNLSFNDVVDASILILSKCKPKDVEETLLLAGEYNDFLKRKLFDIKPVALLGESKFNALESYTLTRYSYLLYQDYRYFHVLRRVQRFVLVTSSQPMLRSVLQRTKDSPWANPEGFYIIIDRRTAKRGCINARSYLWAAWAYDLLSVVFLCIDPDDGIVYYTYNPYSKIMPSSWHEVERRKGRMGHPWIMFRKKFVYNNDSEVCCDLYFDRTTTLNGYMIRLNAVEDEPYLKINLSEKGLNKFSGENSEVVKLLFHKLKASLDIFIQNGTNFDLGGVGSNGVNNGMLTPVNDGRIDMGMNTRELFALWKLKYTYPHARTSLCVITRPTQKISEFTKLITFLSPPVMAAIVIICLMTYAILAKRQGYARAALEVTRLVVCVAILRPPRISSTRIFICMVFILFLNVNSLFQSRWASLLTLPVDYPHINSLESLEKSGYIIYGPEALKRFMGDSVLLSRYFKVSYEACKEFVRNSTNIVCAGDCIHTYHRIKGDDSLDKSKRLIEMTQTFITREDWPLYTRVSIAIQQMVECGLITKFRQDSTVSLRRDWHIRLAKKKGFKVMLLPQLTFSFYILGIGYTCATIIFMVELMVGRSGRRNNRRGNGSSEMSERKADMTTAGSKIATTLAWN